MPLIHFYTKHILLANIHLNPGALLTHGVFSWLVTLIIVAFGLPYIKDAIVYVLMEIYELFIQKNMTSI
jgi:hypothetical protein